MILITTKRGHAGKTSVSYSGNVRYSGPARLPDLMNSWDFANYFNEANANAGQAAVFNDETLGRIQAFIAGEIPLYEGVDGKFRPQTTIANGNSWHFHQQANDNVDGTRSALEYAAGYPAGSTEAWQYMRRDNHLTASLYSDYTLNLKGHNMNVMAGINIEDYNDRYMGISRPDFITVNVPEIGAATGEDKIEAASAYSWSTAGIFARLTYDYKQKYFLKANIRYDGSSRFLRSDRWGTFGSVSAGWNIAAEEFFPLDDHIMSQGYDPETAYSAYTGNNSGKTYPLGTTVSLGLNITF